MPVFLSEGREVVVEGMTESRVISPNATFGTMSPVENRSGVSCGGKAALRGELNFVFSQCTPNAPGVVASSCCGSGSIKPSGNASKSGGFELLRVGDQGTCQGTCLVHVGPTLVSTPHTCQMSITKSGQTPSQSAPTAKADDATVPDNQPPAAATAMTKSTRSVLKSSRSRSMRVKLSICSVSWIDPSFVADPDMCTLTPDWMGITPEWMRLHCLKTTNWYARSLYALRCTGNSTPPPLLNDMPDYRWFNSLLPRHRRGTQYDIDGFRGTTDFRAMQYAMIIVEFDPTEDRVRRVKVSRKITDPGWTRPFKLESCPAGPGALIEGRIEPLEFVSHRGEASSLSGFHFAPQRHPNSAICLAPGEQPVVNGIIKMRAGPETDQAGIAAAKSPYHVPWVWCELLVTYRDGKFRLRGLGSEFPSHIWYVNGQRVAMRPQVADAVVPTHRKDGTLEIDIAKSNLRRVLTAGIAADQPQSSALEPAMAGPMETHPHTAPAGSLVEYFWERP